MNKQLEAGFGLRNVNRAWKYRILASVSMATIVATGALAEPAPQEFHFAAQNLEKALSQYAEQTNVQLLVAHELVADHKSRKLSGKLTQNQALDILLEGSGLTYTYTDKDTIVIKKKAKSDEHSMNASPANGVRLAQATSVAYQNQTDNAAPAAVASDAPVSAGKVSKVSEASDELEEILVQAKRRASTATKFELSVIDTPQSIKAVTGDVIEFASVRDFMDLAKIDASTGTKGKDLNGQQLTFRGFDFSRAEGIKIEGNSVLPTYPTDFFVFDRIEILKGPSSSVYGQNAVGGMVNAVLKRPLSTFGGSVGARVGSWDYVRVEGDVGGPLTEDGKLSFRSVAAYEEGGDFIDFSKNESKLVYGALKYDFDEATSATIIAEYQERDYTPNRGITLHETTFMVPDVPASRLYGAPVAPKEGRYLHAEAEVAHKFSNNWLLKFNTQYARSTDYGWGTGPFGLFDVNGDLRNLNGTLAPVNAYFDDTTADQTSFEVSLTGDFDLLGQSHTFYVGVDHRINNHNYKNIQLPIGYLNIFTPDYDALSSLGTGPVDPGSFGYKELSTEDREFWGGSVQLLLHPADRLSVLIGARWDKSKITSRYWDAEIVGNDIVKVGDPWFDNVLNTTKLVPSVGATFELQPGLNLYANYGKSFVPQTGITFEGRLIEPEEGHQFEGGVKGNFGATTVTLAAFDMARSHIIGIDTEHPAYSLEIGTQKSKGVELDVFGNILPGWSVYGSVAYVDAKITATDRPADIGARLFNVPKYALSLYSNYQFQKGPLTGLGFGGGVVTKQDRVWGLPGIGFIGRQVNPGGYTTVDLRVFYEIGNIMFDLKANNVFDDRYYLASAPGLRTAIYPGRPREFVGSVKYKF